MEYEARGNGCKCSMSLREYLFEVLFLLHANRLSCNSFRRLQRNREQASYDEIARTGEQGLDATWEGFARANNQAAPSKESLDKSSNFLVKSLWWRSRGVCGTHETCKWACAKSRNIHARDPGRFVIVCSSAGHFRGRILCNPTCFRLRRNSQWLGIVQ